MLFLIKQHQQVYQLTQDLLRLNETQGCEGVVAVQGGQEHVQPLQSHPNTERGLQGPESWLTKQAASLQPGYQEAHALFLHLVF